MIEIISHGGPKIKGVLLLLIYLEPGAVGGICVQTRQLPLHHLICIAVTALMYVPAVDIKEMSGTHMLTLTGAILILRLAVMVWHMGSTRFGYRGSQNFAES